MKVLVKEIFGVLNQKNTNNYKQVEFALYNTFGQIKHLECQIIYFQLCKTWQIESGCLSETNLNRQNNPSEICFTFWECIGIHSNKLIK